MGSILLQKVKAAENAITPAQIEHKKTNCVNKQVNIRPWEN